MTKQKKDWGPYLLGHTRRLCSNHSHEICGLKVLGMPWFGGNEFLNI